MNPALARSYFTVTEQPGQPASRIQLEMLEARYAWAAEQAREKDVLEAGCGAGMGLPVLGRVARSVQAGDVDAENLRAARAACAGHANVTLRAFHAQNLPFPDEGFDLVLLFEAIYYLPDVRRFLEETWRVLRPGGTLLIVTVNPEWERIQSQSAQDPLLVRRRFACGSARRRLRSPGAGSVSGNRRLDYVGDQADPARGRRAESGPTHDEGQGVPQADFLWTVEGSSAADR